MTNYHITMQRTDLPESEIERRLALCYDLILVCASETETADQDEFDDLTRAAASDAPTRESEAQDSTSHASAKSNHQ